MRIGTTLHAVCLLVVLGSAGAQSSNEGLDNFFGRYAGTGIVENSDVDGTSMTLRNLDVEIRPASRGGFSVGWTSLIRKFGGDVPTYTRKGLELAFVATDRPGVYREKSPGNVLNGESLTWARLEHPTLTVYQLVPSERGGFEILSYERTLSDQGMDLVFKRLVDGEEVRTVKGALERLSD